MNLQPVRASQGECVEDELLDQVLADYIDAAERSPGELGLLRTRVLTDYPELCEQLTAHFSAEDAVRGELLEPEPDPPELARYRELSRIGSGAMGIVYRAFDDQLQRWVALKMTLVREETGAAARSRFTHEAQSMARLRHPHIVPVFDVGEYQGQPYLSMAMIDGCSLDRQFQRFDGDNVAIATVLIDIARAVHHAHQREILHRDLKPANVLVSWHDGAPHAWVCDFGLAKPKGTTERLPRVAPPVTTSHVTVAGSLIGTASYMSPEQARGEPATTLSDVYGLGAILYSLLAGAPPYRGDTLQQTVDQVRDPQISVPLPGATRAAVDPTLEAICCKCLHYDPDQRYASAEGLARDLERYLAHHPTEARPPDPLRRAGLWCRRNRAGAALIAVALAFLTLVALELAERLDAPRRAQQALADQQAGILSLRFDQLREAVATTASEAELALFFDARDRAGLQRLVEKAGRNRVDLNGISPFESWFVVDLADGHILARWPSNPALAEQLDLRARHYVAGLLDTRHPSGVAVSRVFRSLLDGLYKFGLSAPIRNVDGSMGGALVATVTTSAQMGFDVVREDSIVTALLARREKLTPLDDGARPSGASDYLILLHPAYQRRTRPVWFPQERLDGLASGLDSRYSDPVTALGDKVDRRYAGLWTAVYAPVKDSDFTVVVQQRRYSSVQPEEWRLTLLLAFVGLLALVLVVARRAVRRRLSLPAAARN